MEQSNQSKKVLLSVIGVAILVVAVVGVSFAFFNYTRTGAPNSLSTGTIYFVTEESGSIEITNFFPTSYTGTTVTNSDSMTVTITGGTSYSRGIDYSVYAVNPTGQTTVPVTVHTETTDSGIQYTAQGTSGNVTLNSSGDTLLGKGHIDPETDGGLAGHRTTGTITVTAFLGSDLAITDTPTESSAWVHGRTTISTSAWNALASNPVTFAVRVIADEAIS